MGSLVVISGTNGNDTLTVVQPGGHQLEGLAGNDKLIGGAAGDALLGGTGSDVLDGGGGNDLLIGGEDADRLNGGTGIDTASYTGSSSGVKVSLATGRGSGGDAAGDSLTDIENLKGSGFDDKLVGDANDNRLYGERGDDSLYGGGGNDWFKGGEGADILDGGSGSDTADYLSAWGAAISIDLLAGTASGGEAQGDQLRSIENVTGSLYDDTIVGDAAANVLDGSFGDDTLEGGAGADVIAGSWGVDTASYATSNSGVKVNLETGLAAGGHAQGDVLSEIENLTGSAFGDRLTGSGGDNVIHGGNGDDTIRAGAGADQVWGGAGDDTFVFHQNDQPLSIGGTNFETIGDFSAGGSDDVIDLTNSGASYSSLGDVLTHSMQVQANGQVGTLIDLGPSGQVYLAGVGMASLTESDFIFV
jgi:Ca2+-binding RTX toxin-like protein